MKHLKNTKKAEKIISSLYFYFLFEILAVIITLISSWIAIYGEFGAVDILVKTLIIFMILYVVSGFVIITFTSAYQRDYKVIALLLPLIMTVTGIVLGFWETYQEISIGTSSRTIFFSISVLLVIPALAILAEKSLARVNCWCLYLFNLVQILIAAAIFWSLFHTI